MENSDKHTSLALFQQITVECVFILMVQTFYCTIVDFPPSLIFESNNQTYKFTSVKLAESLDMSQSRREE